MLQREDLALLIWCCYTLVQQPGFNCTPLCVEVSPHVSVGFLIVEDSKGTLLALFKVVVLCSC